MPMAAMRFTTPAPACGPASGSTTRVPAVRSYGSHVPRDLTPTAALSNRSSSAWAEASFSVPDPPPAEVHEMVSARLPTPDEASTLRLNTALAVLAITRVAADNTGRVIEAALLVFPGDRVDAVFSAHHVIEERQAHR
ncbi:UTRA domain-containing protein [Streptomyces sp. NPDC101221]|uniref:UTRA domain-containing protein n=1 Tax=Streptomyces sp. NPDC101221 TaxID=3366132 RepID=UPI00381A8834